MPEIFTYILLGYAVITHSILGSTTEDLKNNKVFLGYSVVFIFLGFIFSAFRSANNNVFVDQFFYYFAFAPCLTLVNFKIFTFIYKQVFKTEPFAIDRNGLSNGFWIKNRGDLKNRWKYGLYSTAIHLATFIPFVAKAFYLKN